MNLDKLKEAARKFEQREDWRRAIDVYLQAIQEAEETGEASTQDPGLYNRVGDLQLKAGDTLAALRAYEQAAELYAEQGFFNNAIALCGKILRVNPSRTATYLRLAQLHARKNFVGEAKKNLVEYLERMDGVGQLEEAFTALKLFADHFSANPDVRLMLVELLRASSRTEDAREQLEKLALELEARGETTAARRTRERLQAIGGPGAANEATRNELVFLDTDGIAGDPAVLESLEPTRLDDGVLEPGESLDAGVGEALLLEEPPLDDAGFPVDRVPGLVTPTSEARGSAPPIGDPVMRQLSGVLAAADFAAGVPSSAGLRERARALLDAGDRAGGLRELEAALLQMETESRWPEALQVASDLIRIEPDTIHRYQKQVELAYYTGDRDTLIRCYLELGDALVRAGGAVHAAQVYRRVLDHDAENAAAHAALALIDDPGAGDRGPGTATAPAAEFVDLGALILGEELPRDTRMRIEEKPEIEDEDRVFRETLADFKRGLDANLDADDFQAHYDLGIAFKEMGLVDEAIAQFQKALRAPEGRLRTSEQLGIAFFEQGQFAIAETVLRRALTALAGAEEEKVGLLYWLGRALEAQGRPGDALPCYEQAIAVDIRFLDVRDRVRRLAAEARA